nr:hypothetical protein [uncultured Rhodoferax sp.]
MTLLHLLGFIAIQIVVFVVAIGCYVRRRRFFYYLAMYCPAITFAVVAGFVGGDDWIVILTIQTILSIVYNIHISSNKLEAD